MKLEDYKPMLCPVCGEFFFSELQDDDELPVWCYHCGWIYDKEQHDNPDMKNGENVLSLNEYKEDYLVKISENPNYDYSEEHQEPDEPHLCPVCGRYEFSDKGSFDICVYCGWEDDIIQLDDPDYDGGANTLSLNKYREEYQRKITKNPSYRWDRENK